MPLGAFKLNSISAWLSAGPILGDFGLYKVLTNPNAYSASSGDSFGRASAISNQYAIVGAYSEDDAAGVNSGKAYIYSATTGSLLYTLDNPNAYGTSAGDFFGYTAAISDQYAIVGAYTEADAGGAGSGKAYIYSTTTGALLYTLDNPNAYSTSANDYFGRSVAISDQYAIVGAYAEDDAGGTNSGKAYIYSTTTGSLLYTLDNPNAYLVSSGDSFGWAVSISDQYAIVGAYNEDDAAGNSSGKAYIYSTTTGSLLYTLDNPNAYSTSIDDYFGYSVAISNQYAIVGAYAEDDAGGAGSGKAYIYSTTTGSLLYTLNNPNAYSTSAGDFFGSIVSISDQYAMVGAYAEDDAGGSSSGTVYMYSRLSDDHIPDPIPKGIDTITSIASSASTIVVPSTLSVGDIAILFDSSTTVTDITPSGWTSITKAATASIRTNVSYKKITSGDLGATVTGMSGTTKKTLVVFRDFTNSNPTISFSTPTSQATDAIPSTQTILAGTGKSIYLGVCSKSTTTAPTVTLTQTDKTAVSVNNSTTSIAGMLIRYNIFDPLGANFVPHSNATFSTSLDAGSNTLQSFRMDIS